MEKDYIEFWEFVVKGCWCFVWDDGLTLQFQTPKVHVIIWTRTLSKPNNPQLYPPHPAMPEHKQILAHLLKAQIRHINRDNTKPDINNKLIHIEYARNGAGYQITRTEIKDGWQSYYIYIDYD